MIDDVFQEGKLKEASRGHEWLEGEQVMSVKDPGPRFDQNSSGEAGSRGRWPGSSDWSVPGVQSRTCLEATKSAG